MLNKLPDDALLMIIKFLKTNKETCALIRTCKALNTFGHTYGWLKRLSGPDQAMYDKHKETITTLFFVSTYSPMKPIPGWTETMHFNGWGYPVSLSPTKTTKTKRLVFRNYTPGVLDIDWKMFPELRCVVICAGSLSSTDFTSLKKIHTMYIRLTDGEWRKNPEDIKPIFVPYDRDPVETDELEPDVPFFQIMRVFS